MGKVRPGVLLSIAARSVLDDRDLAHSTAPSIHFDLTRFVYATTTGLTQVNRRHRCGPAPGKIPI